MKLIGITFLFAFAGALMAGSIAVVAPQAKAAASRTIVMGNKDVADIQCRVRHSCILVFPDDEPVSFASGGGQGRWVMESASKTKPTNLFSLKPARFGPDAETNLNIATMPDRLYSFRLHSCDKCDPDTKVFIEHKNPAPVVVPEDPHVKIIADNVKAIADLNQKIDIAQMDVSRAKEETETEKKRSQVAITEFAQQYPLSMHNDYSYKRNKEPFLVRSIWHDESHTYIQIAGEVSSLYTTRDGKAELLQFTYAPTRGGSGTYVVDRVLKSGYLSLGKKSKLPFEIIK